MQWHEILTEKALLTSTYYTSAFSPNEAFELHLSMINDTNLHQIIYEINKSALLNMYRVYGT